MAEFVLSVQKIELVGGESWLAHNLGPILLAGAAVFAAGIAAYVALHNHREQLAHDRDMRNQDHIRDLLDAAIVSTNTALLEVAMFCSDVETTERWRPKVADRQDQEEIERRWRKEMVEKRDTAYEAINAVRAENIRLIARLGDDDPIVVSHEQGRAALYELFSNAMPGITENRSGEDRAGGDERMTAAQEALAEFRSACRAWFNS